MFYSRIDKVFPITIEAEEGKYINLNVVAKSIITLIYW